MLLIKETITLSAQCMKSKVVSIVKYVYETKSEDIS